MTTPSCALARAVSFLFVPGDRPDRLRKALDAGADVVVVDLEDAVAPEGKPAARAVLTQALPLLGAAERSRLMVRINAHASCAHDDDLRELAGWARAGLAGVMLSKAESAAACRAVLRACRGRTKAAGVALLPLVESLAGFDALDAMATVSGVVRLGFGHIDFQRDMGMTAGPDEVELLAFRIQLVAASRRAGIAAPVDGVTLSLHDAAAVSRDAERARRLGFGGKLCVHPRQRAAVAEAFRPTEHALQWARRVLDAAQRSGQGAFRLDGLMVDAPVLAQARRLLGPLA